jgi:hypothetical protein
MFSNILVGVDRSEHSQAALEQAIDLASAEGAALTVLIAYSGILQWGPAALAPELVDQYLIGVQDDAKTLAADAAARIPTDLSAEMSWWTGHRRRRFLIRPRQASMTSSSSAHVGGATHPLCSRQREPRRTAPQSCSSADRARPLHREADHGSLRRRS